MNVGRDSEGVVEVLEPGLLTTVQDGGRRESTHLGVPIGGACDRWSLAVANVLVGNAADAAGLEMTLVGPTLRLAQTTVVGLAGADLGGIVRGTGRRLEPGRAHVVETRTTIAFPGTERGGARGYLAIHGGFDVPAVLGSASTLVSAGLGGIDGRALAVGDVLRAPATSATPVADLDGRVWPILPGDPFEPAASSGVAEIRVLPGKTAGVARLVAPSWRVAAGSDRVGLRLEGPSIAGSDHGELVSHGVVDGTVQLPPDGRPVVLLADHQTTGGYPVIAVAISADLPLLGQLRPGATVRFRAVDLAEARAALLRQRAGFDRALAALREAGEWDDLWRSAGG